MEPKEGIGKSLFFSYSHRDEGLRDKLETHISSLRRAGVISTWHFRKISAGTEWKGQIDSQLNSADIILLLISADFMASDYCFDVEMKRALVRHDEGDAQVIPVILRDVDWQSAPFAKLQALPTGGRPIDSWKSKDEAFADVARGIRASIEAIQLKHP